MIQVHVGATSWKFESSLRHQFFQWFTGVGSFQTPRKSTGSKMVVPSAELWTPMIGFLRVGYWYPDDLNGPMIG